MTKKITKTPKIYTPLGKVSKRKMVRKPKIKTVFIEQQSPENYDYQPSIDYCKQIGLLWLGDSHIAPVATEARHYGFSQKQFDTALRQHLWQVKCLFTPQNYNMLARIKLAAWFLFGKVKK